MTDNQPAGSTRAEGRGRLTDLTVQILGVGLCLLTLIEVNYPNLSPHSQLALFALVGLVLAFLQVPAHPGWGWRPWARGLDAVLGAISVGVCLYVVSQSERGLSFLWIDGQSLGNRAGQESTADLVVGVLGLLVILEATRRVIGWTLPLLAGAFLLYGVVGPHLPGWLLPHRGYSLERISAQAFLHSQGVFGVALSVMFTYVFLFVLFGALLEATGATGAVIRGAQRLFRNSSGGAAKVSVVASGLMGSLSGSAVANTATTGTFTIPMMRSAGFPRHVAAGVEAAASSGGALMPPVMGAGAYMMLELVDPPVTYLAIVRAALIPALLYYLSLFLIVHFQSKKVSAREAREAKAVGGRSGKGGTEATRGEEKGANGPTEASLDAVVGESRGAAPAVVFAVALASLIVFLLLGYTAFRAVTLSLGVIAVASLFSPATRLTWRGLLDAAVKAARDAVPLIVAAACVGILLGMVTLTGVGTRLPALVLPLAQDSLLAALGLLMVSSIVLGMGLPSAVCYLLLATLLGPVLGDLGVVPLAAHLFIFYFGMMSMVTPPVALAAYTAASISGANILKASFAAFRFALVGFTLPYMFVYRPQLLLLGDDLSAGAVAFAVLVAVAGVVPFAAGIAGYFAAPTRLLDRVLLLAAAAFLLVPGGYVSLGALQIPWTEVTGGLCLLAGAALNLRRRRGSLSLAP